MAEVNRGELPGANRPRPVEQVADPLMAHFQRIDTLYASLDGITDVAEYEVALNDIEEQLPPTQRGSELTIEAAPAVDPDHTPLSQQHFADRAPERQLPVDDIEDDIHPMGENYPDGDIGAANRAARIQRALAARENPITDGPELEALRQKNDRTNARRRAAKQSTPTSEPASQPSPDQHPDQDSDDVLSPSSRVVPTPPSPVQVPPAPAQRAVPPAPPASEPSQPAQEPPHLAADQPASGSSLDEPQEAAPEREPFEPDMDAYNGAITRHGYDDLTTDELGELDHQLQILRGKELRAFDYDKFVAAWVKRLRAGGDKAIVEGTSGDQSPQPSLETARRGTKSVVERVGYGGGVHSEAEDDEGGIDGDEEIKSPEDMTADELQARIQELEAEIPAAETVAAEYDTIAEANRAKLERMWEVFVDAGDDEKVAQVDRLLEAISLSEEMHDKNKPQQ
ncbi:hypothetical protein COY16_06305 [Candidatus Roizmanbacteria bacterium CG_4_10_14_0_2_um_filter_39_13]|uniref:Uncharacterized protein n=1 Tax=Candidatus Roizmanbacteria bacterium CG_4_10_14_0_2_um_filter_39_13 TaxID=1974825 RepID=A0A2M7TUW2_9BACT|nr:MAG: hypothetical protein COY16_06305 [Candidatus Roizmanbacteria bacterium CG_4_10_14_0_2_um_filter_39_13]